jgi:hypothetical protein
MPAIRSVSLRLAAVLAWTAAAALLAPAPARAEEPAPTGAELAKRESIKDLERELRKKASSPRAEKHREEIATAIESLKALGGPEAGKAALAALAFDDERTEKAALEVVEANKAKSLVAPLAAFIEDKDTRRRFRLHALIAHALAVIAEDTCIVPLTELVQSEDRHVVAAAADALAGFKAAPHAKRVEPVRRMIDVFDRTWNLKESVRPEDNVARKDARDDWEVFGQAIRKSLQSLTGQVNLTRPKQFRDWWNDHKHDATW